MTRPFHFSPWSVSSLKPQVRGGSVTQPGKIETEVRADVAKLDSAHPMAKSLAESAYGLAVTLDGYVDDKARAGLHRELRAHLVELARLGVPEDGGFEQGLSTPSVSSPIRDSAQLRPPDPGAGGR